MNLKNSRIETCGLRKPGFLHRINVIHKFVPTSDDAAPVSRARSQIHLIFRSVDPRMIKSYQTSVTAYLKQPASVTSAIGADELASLAENRAPSRVRQKKNIPLVKHALLLETVKNYSFWPRSLIEARQAESQNNSF
ncbi:hypothetical protein EVAR_74995_1 [Eumeta japonica]|uniref:Uncharacterized protein n=1 Tax=Eumeta variegata TaxID=151549 RepID=A0A4C1VAX6_EUMVA|nr:hypothetical protein EVAR_74995_1 [Eumeta japonica]